MARTPKSNRAVKPIRPNEVGKLRENGIPDAAFEAFNELITKNFTGSSAIIKTKDVVKLMIEKGLNQNDIYDNGWLDVENVYRAAGWNVVYDKPGYNEAYDAYFEFKRRSRAD